MPFDKSSSLFFGRASNLFFSFAFAFWFFFRFSLSLFVCVFLFSLFEMHFSCVCPVYTHRIVSSHISSLGPHKEFRYCNNRGVLSFKQCVAPLILVPVPIYGVYAMWESLLVAICISFFFIPLMCEKHLFRARTYITLETKVYQRNKTVYAFNWKYVYVCRMCIVHAIKWKKRKRDESKTIDVVVGILFGRNEPMLPVLCYACALLYGAVHSIRCFANTITLYLHSPIRNVQYFIWSLVYDWFCSVGA